MTMDLNFSRVNSLWSLPSRVCRKIAGPLDSRRMASTVMSINGDRMIKTNREIRMSSKRFMYLLYTRYSPSAYDTHP